MLYGAAETPSALSTSAANAANQLIQAMSQPQSAALTEPNIQNGMLTQEPIMLSSSVKA